MTRTNRWLSIILCGQVAALLVVWLMPTGTPAEKPRKLLEGKLDPSAVTRVHITSGEGKSVELRKQNDNWVLASGGDYPVQPNKVSEFLGKLPGLLAGRPVTNKPTHHAALEVASNIFQREVRIEQPGKPALHFFLGSSAGLKDVHFRLDGDDTVYLVKDLSAYDAGALPADWVNTEYLKLDRESIVSLHLKNTEGEIELSKGSDGKWTLAEQTEETKLKDSEVESLLGSVSSVALQEPVGKKLDPAYGLDKPAATVTVMVKRTKLTDDKKGEGKQEQAADAVPSAERLFIGAKSGDAYYAKSETSPYVVKLAGWTAEALLKKKKADFEEKPKKEGEKKEEAPTPAGMEPLGGGEGEGVAP